MNATPLVGGVWWWRLQEVGSVLLWGSTWPSPGSRAVWGELPREKASWLFTLCATTRAEKQSQEVFLSNSLKFIKWPADPVEFAWSWIITILQKPGKQCQNSERWKIGMGQMWMQVQWTLQMSFHIFRESGRYIKTGTTLCSGLGVWSSSFDVKAMFLVVVDLHTTKIHRIRSRFAGEPEFYFTSSLRVDGAMEFRHYYIAIQEPSF